MESASWQALRLVLDWACEQGMTIQGRLSEEQLERLRAVFCGELPWSFELYQPLRAFSHALPRLDLPDLPARIHFGDCLTALNEALLRDAPAGNVGWERDWTPCHRLSGETFAALGYARTSAGISELRARNVAGWRQHASRSRAFLLSSAQTAPPGSAALIGAGKLYDVPLKELGERFERLTLIDVDGAAMAESVERALEGTSLAGRLQLVTLDVTGCNESLVQAADTIFDAAPEESDCYQALLALLYSYRWQAAPTLGGQGPFGAVFSTMVLSQLAVPLTRYLERRFEQCFPSSQRWRSHELQVALGQFSHRLQHQHLQALLGSGRRVALTSDVSEQYTRLGPDGAIVDSAPLPLLGAPRLADVFPASFASSLVSAEWVWPRLVPGPARPEGRLLAVDGCCVSL